MSKFSTTSTKSGSTTHKLCSASIFMVKLCAIIVNLPITMR
jgi:hypothetical protein